MLKTKFLVFERVDYEGNYPQYYVSVKNKKGLLLGNIIYDNGWKQFVFSPDIEYYLMFSRSCLVEIENVILKLDSGEKI